MSRSGSASSVSMVEFRKDAESVIRRVRRGQRLVLTYRGKPVARLEPIEDEAVPDDDPFYRIADSAEEDGDSLSNEQIDEIVYGS